MNRIAVGALSAALFTGGCTSGLTLSLEKSLDVAEDNGVVISFNGTLSDENRKATGEMAQDMGMLHFHGGPRGQSEIEVLKKASHVYITAHSAGDDGARAYAEFLGKYGIKIREMYFFDSFGNGEIPKNVNEVTDIHSADGAWVRSRHDGAGYVEIQNSNHHDCPHKGMPFVRKDIQYQKQLGRGRR